MFASNYRSFYQLILLYHKLFEVWLILRRIGSCEFDISQQENKTDNEVTKILIFFNQNQEKKIL